MPFARVLHPRQKVLSRQTTTSSFSQFVIWLGNSCTFFRSQTGLCSSHRWAEGYPGERGAALREFTSWRRHNPLSESRLRLGVPVGGGHGRRHQNAAGNVRLPVQAQRVSRGPCAADRKRPPGSSRSGWSVMRVWASAGIVQVLANGLRAITPA